MNDSSASALHPFSIELGSVSSKPFKSIQQIIWQDIPPFAVLTGLNGSGKTQFLQALAYKLSVAQHRQYPELNEMPIKLEGTTIGPDEIAYLPSSENDFRIEGTNIGGIAQAKHNFLQRLAPQNALYDIEMSILRARVQRKFGIQIDSSQPSPDLQAKLPDDFMYMLEYGEVSAGLSHVFVGYQIRRAEKLMEGQTEEQIREQLGKPPWDFVNDALALADFGYRVVPPENRLLKNYHVRVATLDGTTSLDLNDLSSGERTILRTVLWFYNTKHNNIFPKLFLLDEPDAHLHPSMTRQFMDVLKNLLVDQYDVRVILSTHSPSTVALAPDESLFVMSKEQPRISRPTSRAAAIGLLTAGLVIVSPGTRFVLVEDEDDVKFYNAVLDILSDQGPSRDPKALKPAPSLVFLPGSSGKGSEKTGGGKNVVTQWVEKFDAPPLNEMFRGVIDLDAGNQGGPRICVVGRYSIENYLLDPTNVFGLLVEEKRAPSITGVVLSSGDEHRLRTLPASGLQAVVDYVAQQMEEVFKALTTNGMTVVEFTTGAKVKYPDWMLTTRGHDLLPKYQKVFGQTTITPPRLEVSFRRIRLVPIELAQIMSRLQA